MRQWGVLYSHIARSCHPPNIHFSYWWGPTNLAPPSPPPNKALPPQYWYPGYVPGFIVIFTNIIICQPVSYSSSHCT